MLAKSPEMYVNENGMELIAPVFIELGYRVNGESWPQYDPWHNYISVIGKLGQSLI